MTKFNLGSKQIPLKVKPTCAKLFRDVYLSFSDPYSLQLYHCMHLLNSEDNTIISAGRRLLSR